MIYVLLLTSNTHYSLSDLAIPTLQRDHTNQLSQYTKHKTTHHGRHLDP